jgi:type VI secretion system protein ImpB
MASVNDKLERVRKPRVHIKYDVETEGAEVEKELPFTVGVLGDYSGNNPGEALKPLKDRKFVGIDRDNFDNVMHRLQPGIKARVDNTLDDSGSELSVELNFNSMEDFEPEQVIEKVPALSDLKKIRDQLRDLLTKADRSDDLEKLLEEVLQNTAALSQLSKELNLKEGE